MWTGVLLWADLFINRRLHTHTHREREGRLDLSSSLRLGSRIKAKVHYWHVPSLNDWFSLINRIRNVNRKRWSHAWKAMTSVAVVDVVKMSSSHTISTPTLSGWSNASERKRACVFVCVLFLELIHLHWSALTYLPITRRKRKITIERASRVHS